MTPEPQLHPDASNNLPVEARQEQPPESPDEGEVSMRDRLAKAHRLLVELIEDGQTDPETFQGPMRWAGLLDAVAQLNPRQHDLPGWCGDLHRQVRYGLKDSHERLQANPADPSARQHLERLAVKLSHA